MLRIKWNKIPVHYQLCSVCVCCSCPEDRSHQEEAAVVHRAVQVAAQLAESLICLHHTSIGRPHQPGQSSTHTDLEAY